MSERRIGTGRFSLLLLATLALGTAAALLPAPATARPLLEEEQKKEAQAPKPMALVLRYYDRCMEKRDPSVSWETQQKSCACMADETRKSMSPDEIAFMAGADGRPVSKARVFTDVYGPCLRYPVAEYAYFSCYNNRGYQLVRKDIRELETFCACISEKMEDYAAETGAAQTGALLLKTPDMEDPVAALMNGADYKNEFERVRKNCDAIVSPYRPAGNE